MKQDDKGFLYPAIDSSLCVQCSICSRICQDRKKHISTNRIDNVYAAKHLNTTVRERSSSGGAFTAISDLVLRDSGTVYGVAFDENMKLHHVRCERMEQRDSCRGSKYAQSDLEGIYIAIKCDLENGKSVLFTGTPCQTAAVDSYLTFHHVDTSKLLLVDLICFGIIPQSLLKQYFGFVEQRFHAKVNGYEFRDKCYGWRSSRRILYLSNGKSISSPLSEAYMNLYYSKLAFIDSCYNCPYLGDNHHSDITIGDYWKNSQENIANDELGISVLWIHTEKGEIVRNKLEENMQVQITQGDTIRTNSFEARRLINRKDRTAFFETLNKRGMRALLVKYGKYDLCNRIKYHIKRLIGKHD